MIDWTKAGLAACAAAAVAVVTAAPAAAICFVNESDRQVTFQVWHSPKAWKRSSWHVKLNPGRMSCCTGHRLCTGRRVHFTAYYWAPSGDRQRWQKLKRIRLLKYGKVFLPVQGELPRGNIRLGPCAMLTVPGSRLIRVYGHFRKRSFTHHFACEEWQGTRLIRTHWWRDLQKPRLRGHVRVCNQTRDTLYTSLAHFDRRQRGWRAAGWDGIKSGKCQLMVPPRGYQGTLYIHGRTKRQHWVQKDAHFCVNARKVFNLIRADRRTCPPGFKKTGFLKRRPLAMRVQTITFRAPRR